MAFSSTMFDSYEDDSEIFGGPSAPKGPIDFTAVHAMFNNATANGLKKPRFHAEHDLYLSLAPAAGKNPGAIYVKLNEDDKYLGKIVNGSFHAVTTLKPVILDTLRKIAENPFDYAVSYGRKTGECCICSRTLTDPVSVANGIGPICAERYGFTMKAVEVSTAEPAVQSNPIVLECSRVMFEDVDGNVIIDNKECVMTYTADMILPFHIFIRNELEEQAIGKFATRYEAVAVLNATRASRRETLK